MIVEYDRQPPSRVTHLMYLGEEPWTTQVPWGKVLAAGAFVAFLWLVYDVSTRR